MHEKLRIHHAPALPCARVLYVKGNLYFKNTGRGGWRRRPFHVIISGKAASVSEGGKKKKVNECATVYITDFCEQIKPGLNILLILNKRSLGEKVSKSSSSHSISTVAGNSQAKVRS